MNISDRIFTYPVLSNEKDDYVRSKFSAQVNYKASVNSLALDVEFSLDCNSLQKIIDDDQAEFVLHLECSSTGYRKIFKSEYSALQCHIPISKINGKLEILALIIAKSDLNDYSSDDFVSDFSDEKFNIDKASILAYENLPTFEFAKNSEEYNKGDSIFLIYKITSDEKEKMKVSLESPKIRIGLGAEEHRLYFNQGNKPLMQPIFHSLIIFPALVYAFSELKIEGAIEEYRLRDWYQSLELSYANKGINLEDEIVEKTAIELAQEAMDFPINKAFESIPMLIDNLDGEE